MIAQPKESTDTCFVPPPVPKALVPYLTKVIRESPRGVDWEFCSPYMQRKLDLFTWKDNDIPKPTLPVFSRWCLARRKKGVGKVHRNVKYTMKADASLDREIIEDISVYVPNGQLQDSFLGSRIFWMIYQKYQEKYSLDIWAFAKIIIASRKKNPTKTNVKCHVYAYFPRPKTEPDVVKLGKCEIHRHPESRMHESTKNNRSQMPKMIGWFFGIGKDESDMKKHFKKCKLTDVENDEVFKFPKLDELYEYLQVRIKKSGGEMQ